MIQTGFAFNLYLHTGNLLEYAKAKGAGRYKMRFRINPLIMRWKIARLVNLIRLLNITHFFKAVTNKISEKNLKSAVPGYSAFTTGLWYYFRQGVFDDILRSHPFQSRYQIPHLFFLKYYLDRNPIAVYQL